MPPEYLKLFKENSVPYSLHTDWDEIIDQIDVLYMTRVQKERFKFIEDYQEVKDSYILTSGLVNNMKKDAIIMHPLPRVNEIEVSVDDDPRAIYFEQVKNGLYMRMALLEYIFDN
jgi:aspartate carbamoyltransferase catalytic subunit